MNFITRTESRTLNALANYKPRELTPVEVIIRHVWNLAKDKPHSTQAKMKDVEECIKTLENVIGIERLSDTLRKAVNDTKVMGELLEIYPMVEFEREIVGDVKPNGFMMAHAQGIKYDRLQSYAQWIITFYALLEKLPKGVKVYINTPYTDYIGIRQSWANTKESKYLGYVLSPQLQTEVDQTFLVKLGYGSYNPAQHIVQFNLHQEPDLFRRVKLQAPVSDFTLYFDEREGFFRTSLVAVNEKTGSTYYFCQ